MNLDRNEDIGEALRRFDAGDRSPEVLAQLNQAAFECFHAPWEKWHPEDGNPLPKVTQGPLPLTDNNEDSQSYVEAEDLHIPHIIRRMKTHPEPPPPLFPETEAEAGRQPLDRLAGTLTSMGRLPHLCPGRGVTVELPFDPSSDSQSFIAFQPAHQEGCIQMISRGDVALSGLSEADLLRICRGFNRQESGVEAATYRPHEGGHLRLRVIASFPFELTQSHPALEARLTQIFRQDQAFWQRVRRHRPL